MRKKVFILEDNEDIAFVLDMFLSVEGFDVETFDRVSAFNNAFPTKVPDLYLLDVMLPDGNGWNVCNKIKADLHTETVPVLMMSAHTDERNTLNSCSANGFISKPFDLNHVLQDIRQHLKAG